MVLHVQTNAWLNLRSDKDSSINKKLYPDVNPPDINGNEYSYLVTFLYEMGTQWKAGFDVVALPFTEIMAWSNGMQMQLEPLEVEVIRALSSAHVAIATDPESDCPLTHVSDQAREAISNVNESGWKSLARSNG